MPEATQKAAAKAEPKAKPAKAELQFLYRTTRDEDRSYKFLGVRGRRNPEHPNKVEWVLNKEQAEKAAVHHLVVIGRIAAVGD